jgi:hypothetical protein
MGGTLRKSWDPGSSPGSQARGWRVGRQAFYVRGGNVQCSMLNFQCSFGGRRANEKVLREAGLFADRTGP